MIHDPKLLSEIVDEVRAYAEGRDDDERIKPAGWIDLLRQRCETADRVLSGEATANGYDSNFREQMVLLASLAISAIAIEEHKRRHPQPTEEAA